MPDPDAVEPEFEASDESTLSGDDYKVDWSSDSKKLTVTIYAKSNGEVINSSPITWTSPSLIENESDPVMFEFEDPKGLDCTYIKIKGGLSFKV